MRCRPMRPRKAVDQAGGGRSRTRRAAEQRRTAKAGLLASRGRRGNRAGEEGRRRRCGTGGPRQTRRERGPFRAAVEMREVWQRADDARQSAPGTAIIVSMLRDRKSVVSGKRVSVRVDLGGRRTINKKKPVDAINKKTAHHQSR